MGQQQLLLIVLGVIIVGIAVVVGINLFNANAETATQDSLVSQGTNIGAMAQQYYKKPVAMGGGGNDFTGFTAKVFNILPVSLTTSSDAVWTVLSEAADQVVLQGDPIDAAYTWTVETTVNKDEIISAVN
jgi:hypothetical protein